MAMYSCNGDFPAGCCSIDKGSELATILTFLARSRERLIVNVKEALFLQ
jgi:hypothetical protein